MLLGAVKPVVSLGGTRRVRRHVDLGIEFEETTRERLECNTIRVGDVSAFPPRTQPMRAPSLGMVRPRSWARSSTGAVVTNARTWFNARVRSRRALLRTAYLTVRAAA